MRLDLEGDVELFVEGNDARVVDEDRTDPRLVGFLSRRFEVHIEDRVHNAL